MFSTLGRCTRGTLDRMKIVGERRKKDDGGVDVVENVVENVVERVVKELKRVETKLQQQQNIKILYIYI
jgi:hypothetical protein